MTDAIFRHDLLSVAVAVEGFARAVGLDIRVAPLEKVVVLMGQGDAPKGTDPEGIVVPVTRTGVQLEDNYLLVLRGLGFQVFRQDGAGNWVRRTPINYGRDIRKPLINLFQGIVWDRMRDHARTLPESLEASFTTLSKSATTATVGEPTP